MLNPAEKVLLRRRGPREIAPWLAALTGVHVPRAWCNPDEGWRVHEAGDGAVMLESLTFSKSKKDRFLYGDPANGGVGYGAPKARDADGLRWRVHPAPADTFLLECLSKRPGPKWLAATPRQWMQLTDRPEGQSLVHEFVALPAGDRAAIEAAERAGDYSFMAGHEMAADGRPKEMSRPKKPRRTLTARTPQQRSGDDPVARELIAALQPFFDDGEGGAENSDYDPDDPRRIGWPHNIISLATVATPTGIIRLNTARPEHEPPRGEVARCRRLAAELVGALGGLMPFGGDSPTPFRPFYLVAGKGDRVPEHFTPEVVRAAFRGTIFPDTPIEVRPVTDPEFAARQGDKWAGLAAWAAGQTDLAQVAYVEIGYDTCQEPNYAAVFPRLVLGLTRAGSLVGACGSIVQA